MSINHQNRGCYCIFFTVICLFGKHVLHLQHRSLWSVLDLRNECGSDVPLNANPSQNLPGDLGLPRFSLAALLLQKTNAERKRPVDPTMKSGVSFLRSKWQWGPAFLWIFTWDTGNMLQLLWERFRGDLRDKKILNELKGVLFKASLGTHDSVASWHLYIGEKV